MTSRDDELMSLQVCSHLYAESCRQKRWRMFDVERSTLDDVAISQLLKQMRLMTIL